MNVDLHVKNKKKYICKVCNSEFKSSQSRWNHTNKFHKDLSKNAKSEKSLSNNVIKPLENNNKSEYICPNCEKEYNSRQSLWYHKQNCKKKNDEIALLKDLIDEMKKDRDQMKSEIQKLKNNKNINNGNIYNGKTINNNININGPGHEMMTLTKEDIENIFEKKLLSVISYIEKTNFNKEKKYNHNFCATNRDGKYLLSYDMETLTVKSTKKKYFFHDIISNAVKKIDLAYTNHKNKFKKEKQKQFEDIIVRLKEIKDYDFNNKMLKNIFDELNLLCYNSRNVVLNTWENIEIEDEYKDIFIPVKEYLELYSQIDNNSDSEDSGDESETVKPKLIPKKKIINIKLSSDSDDIEV